MCLRGRCPRSRGCHPRRHVPPIHCGNTNDNHCPRQRQDEKRRRGEMALESLRVGRAQIEPACHSTPRPHHWVNVKLGCGTVRVPPRQKPHFFGVLCFVAHRSSSHNGSKLANADGSAVGTAVGSGRLLPGHLTISAMCVPPGKAAKGTKVGMGLSEGGSFQRPGGSRDPLPLVSRPIGSVLSYFSSSFSLGGNQTVGVSSTGDGYERRL